MPLHSSVSSAWAGSCFSTGSFQVNQQQRHRGRCSDTRDATLAPTFPGRCLCRVCRAKAQCLDLQVVNGGFGLANARRAPPRPFADQCQPGVFCCDFNLLNHTFGVISGQSCFVRTSAAPIARSGLCLPSARQSRIVHSGRRNRSARLSHSMALPNTRSASSVGRF
jgi:hypothetical protein